MASEPSPAFHLPARLATNALSVAWTVGRLFGFQAFNDTKVCYNPTSAAVSPTNSRPVAATIPLASDHITAMLGSQYARLVEARYQQAPASRQTAPEEVEDLLFHQAVLEVHTVLFESYVCNWCPLVELRPLPQEVASLQHTCPAASWTATHSLLSQISLYMLIWVEAANMRHMGETLWFFYWTMIHSPPMVAYCLSAITPDEPLSRCHTQWRLRCRTLCAEVIAEARRSCGLRSRDPEVCLIPAAAAEVEFEDYMAAANTLRLDMRDHMEQHMPAGRVAQLGKELLDQDALQLPPGLPLHLASCVQGSQSQAQVAKGCGDDAHELLLDQKGVKGSAVNPNLGEQLVWWQLLDLALHGDGGWVVERLVTPIFLLLAHEMDTLGSEDPCHRLGYDDVNESFCRQHTVHRCLARLGVNAQAIKQGHCNHAYRALTVHMGRPQAPPARSTSSAPSATAKATRLPQAGAAEQASAARGAAAAADRSRHAELVSAAVESFPSLAQAADADLLAPAFDVQRAQGFWSSQVAVKTFVETRSWWAVFKVFWRVWALNLLCLQLTTVLAFFGPDPLVLSSLVPAHAILVALGRIANAITTRHPAPSTLQRRAYSDLRTRHKARAATTAPGTQPSPLVQLDPNIVRLVRREAWLEGAPLLLLGGWLESVLMAVGLTGLYAWRVARPEQLVLESPPVPYVGIDDLWYLVAAGYATLKALHWLLTAADGYTRSLLDTLGLPAWLVAAYSCRPGPRHHLAGSLALGLIPSLLQALAFTLVYILKLAFEFYVLCKPMVEPVNALLSTCWPCLADWPRIQLNWLLVVLRFAPALLLCQIDGMVCYHLLLSVWTLMRGVMFRDLVNLHNWDGGELARDFHAAPARWWAKCMSAPARTRQLLHVARTAPSPARTPAPCHPSTPGSSKHPASLAHSSVSTSLSSTRSKAVVASGGNTAAADRTPGQGGGPASISVEVHKSGAAPVSERLACSQWRAFTAAWDCLLLDLRAADLLSNAEASHLALHDTSPCITWLAACLANHPTTSAPLLEQLVGGPDHPSGGLLGPVLLPGMLHEGVLQQLVDGGGGGSGSLQCEATLKHLRGVGVAVLVGCGFITAEEASVMAKLGIGWRAVPRVAAHQEARQALLGAAQQLAALLLTACGDSTPPATTPAALLSLSPRLLTALKNVLKGLEVEVRAARAQWFSPPALDHHLRVLATIQQRVAALGAQQAADSLTRLACPAYDPTAQAVQRLPSQRAAAHARSQSFNEPAASAAAATAAAGAAAAGGKAGGAGGGVVCEGALLLVRNLQVLLSTTQAEAKPRSGDARRALTSFLNSLAMDSLTSAPSLVSCPSLATLTPVYHEDVVYALQAKHVAANMTPAHNNLTAGKHATTAATKTPGHAPAASVGGAAVQQQQAGPRARHARSISLSGVLDGSAQVCVQPAVAGAPLAELKAELAAASAGLADLLTEGGAGEGEEGSSVSLITYMQTIFGPEFDNFRERIAEQAGLPAAAARKITPHDFAAGGALAAYGLELQLWASYRGQLLARTVRGMECYHKALGVLAALEHPQQQAAVRAPWVDLMVHAKYQHIVSAQVYGSQRTSKELRDRWNAQGIELLLRRHPALRVAYVDAQGPGQPSYSVLLKAVQSTTGDQASIEEVYRVRLPANPSGRGIIIGEGKPENQNHAVIFCITEAIQTIDANQDNTVSEALKVCNVLQELGLHGSRQQAELLGRLTRSTGGGATCEQALVALSRAKAARKTTALVGLREWIFSNRVGALGGFAAATEYAFSTVIQRGMAAGGVRLHYGHPDIFNSGHVRTRGGLSKATRGLHVSEDVFAGLSHLGRGAQIKHCEHSSVGKGRDMGLDSIMGFESKISAGNAQVFLSRDLARLAPRLDLPRVLHFYFSGLGYFPTAVFTVMAFSLQLLTCVALALAGVAQVKAADGSQVAILYGTPLAILTGLVSNLPWIAITLLEAGFISTVLQITQQLLSGSLMFFAFRMQTTALQFANALTYPGGATYIATGRGFAYQPRSFIHIWTQYGRSHLQPGLGLLALLIVLGPLLEPAGYSIGGYATLTWPMWIHAFSLVLAPYWFTPESFSWSKVRADWAAWKRWQLGGEQDSAAANGSWATWNRRELERVRNWHGRQTNTFGTVLLGVTLTALPCALLAFLAALQLLQWGMTGRLLCASVGLWALVGLMALARPLLMREGKERRWWQWKVLSGLLVLLTIIGYTVALAAVYGSYGALPLLYTLILHCCTALLVHRLTLYVLPPLRFAWLVDGGCWLLDVASGGLLLCMLSILCLGGLLSSLQAVLIFNAKYVDVARGGKLANILAKRQGGLGAAAAGTGGRTGRDAAAVLADAADAVEREAAGETSLMGRAGGLGAAFSTRHGVGGVTVGSAGRAAGRKLASWIKGHSGAWGVDGAEGEDDDLELGGSTVPPPHAPVRGRNRAMMRALLTDLQGVAPQGGPVGEQSGALMLGDVSGHTTTRPPMQTGASFPWGHQDDLNVTIHAVAHGPGHSPSVMQATAGQAREAGVRAAGSARAGQGSGWQGM